MPPADFTGTQPDTVTSVAGTTLAGRYTIQRELGAGGMALVYLAHDVQHDRKVALKVLRSELAAVIGPDRFLAEIKTTANLQHPHILALFDSGRLDGTVYYVMPFIEGESLRDRLNREKQLPVDEAVRIAREVAGALDYAHRHGVIHRDIKPENILLHDGQALVADFGIALAASRISDSRMTETGMSLGTPTYMSPEQAMGERSVDARTDIYALGCVLYEMLAGEPPFTGPTAQAIVARVLTDQPRRLTVLRRTVPPHVEDVIAQALEKLPADRVGTAKEFAAALDAVDAKTTRRFADTTRDQRSTARQPVVIALGAAVGLLAALAVWQAMRLPETTSGPSLRFDIDLPSDTRLAIYPLIGPNVAISTDGRIVVFVAEEPDGGRRLYQRAMDAIDPTVIQGTEGATQPKFSPDGRSIAYFADGRLMRATLDGSAPQLVTASQEVAGLTWAPNGMIILPQAGKGVLVQVPATGGLPRVLATLDTAQGEIQQAHPVALADGEHVLYTSFGTSGTMDLSSAQSAKIGVVHLSSGKTMRLDLAGATPLGMIDERVVYATSAGDIFAAPVDLQTGRVLGEPIAVASGVTVGSGGIAKAGLSWNGTLVYLGGERTARPVLVNVDGGRTQSLLADSRSYGYPRFSPDGQRIALTLTAGLVRDVWLYEFTSGTFSRLTSGGSSNERPEWSPDGGRILFRTDRRSRSSIWWQRVDRSEPATPLLPEEFGPFFEAVISPDGKYVVYQVDSVGSDIEYRSLSGDPRPHPIATSKAQELMPRLSHDGRWVAFATEESGTREVVVQPFPGPGPRVQVSTKGGTEPVWSPDGRRLYYRSSGKIIAANVRTTPTFAVMSRDDLMDDVFQLALSPHANYDVSPDGTKLLLLRGADRQTLILVHSWASEVRSRLASR